jgi:SAM-dependent methyltransferase
MPQGKEWEREYRQSKFLTKDSKPQADVVRFVKYLKEAGIGEGELKQMTVLDLGSGTGRNSQFFAEKGAKVIGYEISETAIKIAEQNAAKAGVDVQYKKQSIGDIFPLEGESVDIILDITSSNSLSEAERQIFLIETNRVLKPGGYFFTKALCKDGDQNAKKLLKMSPGKEKDTYVLPEVGIVERIWTKEDFLATYEKYFTVLYFEKKTNYSIFGGQPYKRNFWLAYMKK